MLWSRRTCPFGLPDDTEVTDDVILISIGHALQVATSDIVETPLPAPLAALLAQLQRRERNAQARRNAAMRRQRATQRQPADPRVTASVAALTQAAP